MLQNWLKSFAARQWEIYSFKDEWAQIICLVMIAKLLTCAISIFSGYAYLYDFLYGSLNSENAAKFFAVLILVLIEGLNWFLLDKAFKFILHGEYRTAVLPTVLATGVFVLSFNLSANGIAIWKSERADLSTDINGKFNAMVESSKSDIAGQIHDIDENIKDIKSNPEQWSNGKRCVLSAEQNKALQSLYDKKSQLRIQLNDELKEIETNRKSELAENATNTTDQANRYYYLVSAIMVIQFLCNLYLMYCWKKIHGEEAPEKVKAERLNMTFASVAAVVDSGIDGVIDAKRSEIKSMFDLLREKPLAKLVVTEDPEEHQHSIEHDEMKVAATANPQPEPLNEPTPETPKTFTINGFMPTEETAKETPTETPKETAAEPQETPQTETPSNPLKLHVPPTEETATETAAKPQKETATETATEPKKETAKTPQLTQARNIITVQDSKKIKFTNCQYECCGKPLTEEEMKHGAKFCHPSHRLAQWKLDNKRKKMNLRLDQAQD